GRECVSAAWELPGASLGTVRKTRPAAPRLPRRPAAPVARRIELGVEVFRLYLADDATDHAVTNSRQRRQRGGDVLEERRSIGEREWLGGGHHSGKLLIG